ncbi:MAG: hypothetical protein ACREBH_04345 [Candidatus Micrarchaeaceae archaeon]
MSILELIFKNDDNLTRAIGMYNSFGPPDALPEATSRYPAIFGEQFYNIANLNLEIISLPKRYKTLFAYLFNEEMNKKLRSDCKEILNKMEKLVYAPVVKDVVVVFTDVVNTVVLYYLF